MELYTQQRGALHCAHHVKRLGTHLQHSMTQVSIAVVTIQMASMPKSCQVYRNAVVLSTGDGLTLAQWKQPVQLHMHTNCIKPSPQHCSLQVREHNG